jgi:hypothetical protein
MDTTKNTMRKITQQMSKAFYNNENFSSGNTKVSGAGIFLHGNKIAEFQSLFSNDGNKNINITLAGWNTPTTRERLNGLEGVRVSTRKGQAYLNGKAWGGEWVTVTPAGEVLE